MSWAKEQEVSVFSSTPSELAHRRSLGQLTVVTRAQHGLLLLQEGRVADAISQLDGAVQLIDDAEPEDQCKILISRGEAHNQLGHIQSAIEDFSHAVDLSRRYGLTELEFAARHNLGYMHYLAGNLPRSLELMPTVEQAASDHYKGVVGIDRSRVLLSAGLVADADRTLLEASAALERTEMLPLLAEAELARAEVALLAGNYALAQEVSRTAVSRLRQRSNARATALGELVVLRADAEAGNRADKLVRDRRPARGHPRPVRHARPGKTRTFDRHRVFRPQPAKQASTTANYFRWTITRSPTVWPPGPNQAGLRPRQPKGRPTAGAGRNG